MELGMIGLGRMGANMTERLLRDGHRVISYDRSPEAIQRVVDIGAMGSRSLADFVKQLSPPRAIWLMVPAGDPVDQTIEQLLPQLSKGDVFIDGGNSNYKDSIRRAEKLKQQGLHFVDAGTSGGIWGLKVGYCMMIGGENETVARLESIFKTLAPADGFLHVGPCGAGHFVKMIHNGIEYGMLQAYGEGFELLKASQFDLDLEKISHLWNQGSVVRSWLLELCESAFARDPELASIKGYVEDSGEGRWMVEEAIEKSVPAPVLMLSLFARFASRQEDSFSAKVIAALRNEFGGHAVKKE
ncbi:MAG: decarboxylating 6-phosphogluconate dehydrogenase [Deltaproteobacteria bacterium]|nr:decarboxylating 6-phosphogluconate dehydrogenase [Deltaproteobacteria bacterium]MDZ4345475.1 decarboxylating 6-phosphogluconate dehydrogenase [Candidatus Binatia bacterium]